MIRPWTGKPPQGWQVNALHPLGSRVLAAFLLNERGGAVCYNAASTDSITLNLTPTWDPGGNGVTFSATGQTGSLPAVTRYRPPSGISYLARVYISASSFTLPSNIIRADDGATNRMVLLDLAGAANNNLRMLGFTSGTAATAVGSTALAANTWYDLAGTFDAATLVANVYVNGVLDGTATGTGTIYKGSAPAITSFGHWISVNAMLGTTSHWMVFAGALSAREVLSMATRPYQIITPRVFPVETSLARSTFRRSLGLRAGSRTAY